MARRFHPRHALLTGAAGAIGGAIAQRLHDRYPELHLTLVDRDGRGLSQLATALAGRTSTVIWDLCLPSTLARLWERSVEAAGEIDLLINCAGFMEVRSFAKTDWELGERLLTVDLITPLRLMNLAVARMPDSGGSIVNISSMAGRVPLRGCSYYGAAKAGLEMASKIAGLELSKRGIHVLTVLPGPVRSGLEARARAQVPKTRVSERLPTGEPHELAMRIERALVRRTARLVYPRIYELADLLPSIASCFTAAASPEPLDEP